jgi:ABC-type bacteriocin/lantibiotic exporter with double-glycine peptidase domain
MLQMEAAECGSVCLAMVLAAFGRWETLDAIRDSCAVSRDGTSAASIVEAAESRGLKAQAFSRDINDLAALPLPQILFWGFDHFVVLEAVRGDHFVIVDPAHGRRQVDRAEFGRRFTGITLVFEPGPEFRRTARPRGTLRRLVGMLAGSTDMFVAIIVASFTMVALGVLVPGLTRIFVDDYLVQGYGDWLIPLLLALLAVGILQSVLSALYLHGMLMLQTKVTAVASARFVWRLFQLPYDFFVRRSAVEVSSRAQLAGQVAGTVSGPLTQAAVNVLALIGYAAVMWLYSPELTAVVVVLAAIQLIVLRAVNRRIQEQAVHMQMAASKAHAATVQGAALLEQARATGTEDLLFERMMEAEAQFINVEQQSGRTTRLLSALPYAMSRMTTLAVLGVGAVMVIGTDATITGTEMTLGTLLGFLMLSTLFSTALGALTGVGTAVGQSAGALSRLGDALDGGEAAVTESPALPEPTGRITLSNVSFAYSNGNPVFTDIDLTIDAGSSIGIMGASSGGKSTLARLLVGLVMPTGGQLRFEARQDGRTIWSPSVSGIAFVEQTPFLPGGSLRAALTSWNAAADAASVERALADAEIADVVAERPGRVDCVIGEGGGGFSGGERQRLAIARALVEDPRILVLDDATSALDEETEIRLLDNLRRRQITVVLMTNRTSAIQQLDRAVALHEGRLVALSQADMQRAAQMRLAASAPEPAENA